YLRRCRLSQASVLNLFLSTIPTRSGRVSLACSRYVLYTTGRAKPRIQAMARDKISDLYERHKGFPRGRNSENHPAPYNAARYDASPRDGALRNNHAQDPENFQDHSPRKADGGSRYLTDVDINSWLRNGRAESKPSYDKGGAHRTDRHSGMADQ